MSTKVGVTTLNATTYDIINTIRANATLEYQNLVPEVNDVVGLRKVGDVLYGYPAMANQFINALINRIASVRVKSATFNNAYAELKKGYLEYGETVEEVFVGIAKAREFNVEKAEKREFKRTVPNVKSAFHIMNYKVQYPITIQEVDLRQAFQTESGVQDLIAKVIESVFIANEYDEYLLFKYLLIKAISKGKMYPVSIGNGDLKQCASKFRGMSNQLTFMSDKYNAYGVTTNTSKNSQYIFMDSMFNAEYDVNVLASAFNMDKAEFSGKLKLIDDWTTFDNERFSAIIENSDCMEVVTQDELNLMKNVKAVLIDEEWFQVYDNHDKMTETYVASGQYWNYFYNVWKTVSSSPFSNAIVFVTDSADTTYPTSLSVTVSDVDATEDVTVVTLECDEKTAKLIGGNVEFIQTEESTRLGVGVHRYGVVMIPNTVTDNLTLQAEIVDTKYTATTTINKDVTVGTKITFSK